MLSAPRRYKILSRLVFLVFPNPRDTPGMLLMWRLQKKWDKVFKKRRKKKHFNITHNFSCGGLLILKKKILGDPQRTQKWGGGGGVFNLKKTPPPPPPFSLLPSTVRSGVRMVKTRELGPGSFDRCIIVQLLPGSTQVPANFKKNLPSPKLGNFKKSKKLHENLKQASGLP